MTTRVVPRVRPIAEGVEIDCKRCRLPVVVVDECPSCGADAERDLSTSYLSYPDAFPVGVAAPRTSKVYFTCEACEHEWTRFCTLRVDLEIAP